MLNHLKTTTITCADRCGRYLVLKQADVPKVDTDWRCPICEQDRRDRHFSAQLEQPAVDPVPVQTPADVLSQAEIILGQCRVLYEDTLGVQRKNLRLEAVCRSHGIDPAAPVVTPRPH